jgi:UDP-N-acetylmuramoylalanine--D-glutamate ligase
MPTLVLAVPDSGPRIQAAVEAAEPAKVDVVACDGLDAAVERGFGWALPDGVVLLSPAAPSFGRFRDYADRAEAFARAMTACRG